MSSDESQPVVEDVHTPYCDDNCKIKHHPLLQAIIRLSLSSSKEKDEMNKCIAASKAQGWDMNDPIPDPVPEFRYPIIHWSAALCKNRLVSYLIKEGCNVNLQTVQGDTPLHRCVTCLQLRNKRGHLLVGTLVNNLSITNAKGHTPLLLLAERLDHAQISPDQFSDWLIAILEATMKIMDVGQRLKTFNTQNQQGDTTLHLLCNVRNMLPSVRRLTQEARCNVKIRNKLGLTPMDVAASCGFYTYVTEMKSVLPSTNLTSPLRSSHPVGEKKTRSSVTRSPPKSRQSTAEQKQKSRSSNKSEETSTPKLPMSKKRSRSTDKKRSLKRMANSSLVINLPKLRQEQPVFIQESRQWEERSPPTLEKMKSTNTAASTTPVPTTSTTPVPITSTPIPTEETPEQPIDMKRPRKETPYKIVLKDDPQEQRQRVSNLDRILYSQCQGTPVAQNKDGSVRTTTQGSSTGQLEKHSRVQHSSDSEAAGASSDCATTSGLGEDGSQHSHDDKCVLCNLESGSKMSHLENGSKVSEMKVSTAAAGDHAANEPGASGEGVGSGSENEAQSNSKLLTYLQMNQDFQKEIINKIHKDRRELEKTVSAQENSIQGTTRELELVTSDANEVIRLIATTQQRLEALKSKEKHLRTKQEKLRKNKKSKESKLVDSQTQLAVIAQSLLELQG